MSRDERSFLEREIPGRYEHVGSVTVERLSEFYNRASCLVYISSYEGFGIPIVEAMKAGCPVVALRKSSLPEAGGSAAIYIETASEGDLVQAIRRLEHPDVRRRAIEEGVAWAARFSWDESVRRLAEFQTEVQVRRHARG